MASNFIKKETLAQVFSREFCKIFKNIFSTEHLSTSASVLRTLWSIYDEFFAKMRCTKNKFSIKYLFSKYDQIHSFRI